ncbi:ribosome-associated protein [Serinibacter salmoneus]|uniref:Ribosome-associated protein n=2 Tax=Serinibacter salmoneus TaxID=556530 RepID=A0A2A9D0D5_9MICO|nr:ribosome-associated protein [Serinibacter salmoneus]
MGGMEIEIRDETIRLGQLLKLAGIVEDGAAVKELLADEAVRVDGALETRRGAQVRRGSVVEVDLPGGVERVTVAGD